MMEKETEEDWDIEITPKSALLDLKLNDVWQYRDLLILLVKRDFIAFYKQTILGPVWFFVQPVITIVMYTIVFGNLAGIPTDDVPKPLFYLAGTIIWNYFADCLTKTSTVFKDNAGMLSKVYFPRLIMPLSIVLSNLVKFGVQLILFIVLLVFYWLNGATIQPNMFVLLFPLLVIFIAGAGLGLGMMISAVTTKYRDLAFIVSFGVPLLMYSTTVIYPLSEVLLKHPNYQWFIKLNPVTAIIETFRYGFLGRGSFSWALLGYSSLITILLLITGIIVFNRIEKNFVDTV